MRKNLGPDPSQPWVFIIGDGTTDQTIPNETWTTVTNFSSYSTSENLYPEMVWSSATPSRLYSPIEGNVTQIWEVAFEFDATETGVRGIRTRLTQPGIGTLTAEGPVFYPGMANPTGNDAATGQHMQICHFGPIDIAGSYFELQVYQNSGGDLDLLADMFTAPMCMHHYTDW